MNTSVVVLRTYELGEFATLLHFTGFVLRVGQLVRLGLHGGIMRVASGPRIVKTANGIKTNEYTLSRNINRSRKIV